MDRAQILAYLQAAEEHISNGARQIVERRDLVFRLKSAGIASSDEIVFLREMENTQRKHIAERDRLRAELAALSDAEKAGASLNAPTPNAQRRKRRVRRTPYGVR